MAKLAVFPAQRIKCRIKWRTGTMPQTCSEAENANNFSCGPCLRMAAGPLSCAGAACTEAEFSLSGVCCEPAEYVPSSCAQGSFLECQSTGSDSHFRCNLCPAGYFKDTTFPSDCTECPAGKYSGTLGESSCKNCGLGKYKPATWSGENKLCLDCLTGAKGVRGTMPEGSTQVCDSTHTDNCLCEPYTKSSHTFAEVADCPASLCPGQCPPGRYDSYDRSFCALCPNSEIEKRIDTSNSGYCNIADVTQVYCLDCDPGKFGTGQGACEDCSPGRYSSADKTECIPCPAGKWSDDVAANSETVCKACVAGRYSSQRGANALEYCLQCGPGKYMTDEAGDHESKCIPCPAGFVSHPDNYQMTTTGHSTGLRTNPCEKCDPGKYMDEIGYTGHSNSVTGEVFLETSCKDCPAGFFH